MVFLQVEPFHQRDHSRDVTKTSRLPRCFFSIRSTFQAQEWFQLEAESTVETSWGEVKKLWSRRKRWHEVSEKALNVKISSSVEQTKVGKKHVLCRIPHRGFRVMRGVCNLFRVILQSTHTCESRLGGKAVCASCFVNSHCCEIAGQCRNAPCGDFLFATFSVNKRLHPLLPICADKRVLLHAAYRWTSSTDIFWLGELSY